MRREFPSDLRRELADARDVCDRLGLLAGRRGVDFILQPRGAKVRCPKHGGCACSVTSGPDGTVRVRCFACDFTGDVLTLVAAVRGLDLRADFPAVLQEAANLAGMAQPPAPIARESELEAPAVTDETYDRIAAALLNGCSPMRSASPHAAAYLDRRGVFADAEAVGVRGLPRDGQELSTTLLGTFERGNLESASVLRRGYDTLNWPAWELVIPWRDRYGRIVCLQRRHLGDVRPKYRFPFGRAPRAPFGVDLLADALGFHGPEAAVVIVEGALDCLARRRIARHQGERLAVLGIASAGTPAVGLPLDLLAGRCVVLALDRDEAGTRARDELAKVLADVASELRVAA